MSTLRKTKRNWRNNIILRKRICNKVGFINKIFGKKHNQKFCQQKVYELTYIIEGSQQKRLSELAEKFREVNGWNEKEMLQFAVTATQQIDIDMKLRFLEGIVENLEKENKLLNDTKE